jgi:hypothetical protein
MRLDATDEKKVADRYFNTREPYERSRSTLEPLSNVKKLSNKMIIDSFTNNKEILSMLSPKVTKTRPSMLSPKSALDAANFRNGPYSPPPADQSPLFSPVKPKRKKKKMELTFAGSTQAATDSSPVNSPPTTAHKNDDSNGKALHHETSGQAKKLKATRFKLADPGVEMTTEILEQWVDKCLKNDKDV